MPLLPDMPLLCYWPKGVHSHLMFVKLVLSENLGGILGGTQC
jgi:hypothetical protein